MDILVVALACGIACSVIASNKNRSRGAWFVLGCLFPLISLIVIACLSRLEAADDKQIPCPHCGEPLDANTKRCPYCKEFVNLDKIELPKKDAAGDEVKICPYCAETIKKKAVVCRFCGRELTTVDTAKEIVLEAREDQCKE